MSSWISSVKDATFHLENASVSLIVEDVILVLTEGLSNMYSSLIVALDSIPPNDITPC